MTLLDILFTNKVIILYYYLMRWLAMCYRLVANLWLDAYKVCASNQIRFLKFGSLP